MKCGWAMAPAGYRRDGLSLIQAASITASVQYGDKQVG